MVIPNQTNGDTPAPASASGGVDRADPQEVIQLYEQAKSNRGPMEEEWRIAASHCFPSHAALWQQDGLPDTSSIVEGRKDARRRAFDTTGMRSVPKYVAVLNRMATPNNQMYHVLSTQDEDLRGNSRVRAFFHSFNKLLWDKRYEGASGFIEASSAAYASMAVYGPGPMYIGKRKLRQGSGIQPGAFYKACTLRDLFVLFDNEGKPYTWFYRRFMTCADFKNQFPGQPLPPAMAKLTSERQRHTQRFEIVEYVRYRTDDKYDPDTLDNRRYPLLQDFICIADAMYVGDQDGFLSSPFLLPKGDPIPGLSWGSSPALRALGSMGAASTMKKQLLQHGHRVLQPTILAHDDAVFNGGNPFKPASVLAGGLNRQGQPLYQTLQIGDPRYTEQMMQDERFAIEDSFFVTLFQILQDNPRRTATEVMEQVSERTALLMPVLGMLQTELLAPMIMREIDLMVELGLVPELPPELAEREIRYQITYTSPMARAVYAEEITAFLRLWDIAANVASVTQDQSVFDHFNMEEALPEIAENMAVPARWLSDREERERRAEARAQQQTLLAGMENAAGISSLAQAAA